MRCQQASPGISASDSAPLMLLLRIAVAGVDHDAGIEAGLFELRDAVLDVLLRVIGAGVGATKNDVAAVVALYSVCQRCDGTHSTLYPDLSLNDGGEPLLGDGEEDVARLRRSDRVDSDTDRPISAVLEA